MNNKKGEMAIVYVILFAIFCAVLFIFYILPYMKDDPNTIEQIEKSEQGMDKNWACMDGCYEMLLEIEGVEEIDASIDKIYAEKDIIKYSRLKKLHCLCAARCSLIYYHPNMSLEDYEIVRGWCNHE